VLLGETWPPGASLLALVAVAGGLLLVGFRLFTSVSDRFVEEV
jgi:ABC-type polysaccharide/polyol phosphate export permease